MSSITKKAEKLNSDVYESDFALIDEVQKTHNLLSRKEAIHLLCDAFRGIKSNASDQSTCPENCKDCELFGGMNDKGILCILKAENKLPTFKYYSLFEAQACSTKSTLITLARKKELTDTINNLLSQIRYLRPRYDQIMEEVQKLRPISDRLKLKEKEFEEFKRPHETLLAENTEFHAKVQELENTLLLKNRKIEEQDVLIKGLQDQLAVASESELLKENDTLHLEVTDLKAERREYEDEIEKLQALASKRGKEKENIINHMKNGLRSIQQYAPRSQDAFEWKTYCNSIMKTIENMNGFLNVMAN